MGATPKYLHTPQHSVKIVFLYQSKVLRSKLITLVNFTNFPGERAHCSLQNELDICSSVVKGHIVDLALLSGCRAHDQLGKKNFRFGLIKFGVDY